MSELHFAPGVKWRGLLPFWLLLPAASLLVAFLVIPLGVTLWLSLSPNVLIEFQGPGLDNFYYLFGRQYYLDLIVRTVRMAGLAAFFAILIGYPAALAMRSVTAGLSAAVALAVTLPVLCGPLVVVLGFMTLLAQGGPVLSSMALLGLPQPRLVGSEAGIIISMVHFLLPFVVLSLASILRSIPEHLIEAAQSLGATPLQRFRRIIWPLSLPGVLSAAIIAFSLGTSAYVAPHYLGGPADLTLTTLVAQFVMATFNGELAAASALVLTALVGAAVFVLTLIVRPRG